MPNQGLNVEIQIRMMPIFFLMQNSNIIYHLILEAKTMAVPIVRKEAPFTGITRKVVSEESKLEDLTRPITYTSRIS
jgi:hypothetical protein